MKYTYCFLFTVAVLLLSCNADPRSRRDIEREKANNTDVEELNIGEQIIVSEIVSPTGNTFQPFNLKLYIENSGSMDGYVDGGPDFKNAIHTYINEIKIRDLTQNVSLNFINSEIIEKGSDVQTFFASLNSSATFRKSGGIRKSTDISFVIQKVLDNCDKNDVGIIVSDFIFSPGKGRDASQYLVEQQINIKGYFAEYLKKNPQCAVMFIQLAANFKGTFYNREDAKTPLNTERPYYMLIAGSKTALKAIRTNVSESLIDARNIYTAEKTFSTPDYAIKMGTGNFARSRSNPKHAIANAKKGRDNNMTFDVDANLSTTLLDDSYLYDADNYELSDKAFTLTVAKASSNQYGYTHTLKLSCPNVKKTTLAIKLLKKSPQWIRDFDDPEGLDINTAINKTYGLKTIIGGISSAFALGSDYYTELLIDINK